MVKRDEIERRIRREARRQGVRWTLDREGARHSVFRLGNTVIPIPRHVEIGEGLARDILRECEVELGKNWWK